MVSSSLDSLDDFLLLGLEPFMVLAGFLGLRPAGLSLVHQKLLGSLVCLQLVDMFHENLLGFEHITLHLQVQAVIHVEVNLLRCTVSPEHPAQNSPPPHPGYLLSIEPENGQPQASGDQPIFDQLPDLLAGVGIGDFTSLTGIQPDLLFATVKDTGGKPLLKPERTRGHCHRGKKQ